MGIKGILILYDSNKEEIKRISLLKAPFREDLIIEMSIKMFGEENPCVIYKTVCLNKLGMEMQDRVNKLKIQKEDIFNVNENEICKNFILESEVKYISFL